MNHVKKYTKRIKVVNNYVPGKKKKLKKKRAGNESEHFTFYLIQGKNCLVGWWKRKAVYEGGRVNRMARETCTWL